MTPASRHGINEEVAPAGLDLFVVHSSDDAAFLQGYLLPALGLPEASVLRIDDLALGAMAVSEIERGLAARFTLIVCSWSYLADRFAVFVEQVASHASLERARVIPLQLTACELPQRLRARIPLDFTDRTRWEAETARLRGLLGSPVPVAKPIDCPYPGMRPFDIVDAPRFFGRGREIDELVHLLDRAEREIYVIGPSGSGKSSLVQAGLLHVLDTGQSRLGHAFVTRTTRPGSDPTERIAAALALDPAAPASNLDALLARHPPASRVLLFIDQLEEVFKHTGTEPRRRFLSLLDGLRRDPRCHLVLALRADFFGALMDSELWTESAARKPRLEIAPLRGEALRLAILRPAHQVEVQIEPRLCDRLVADAATEPGALPLVQETLRQLWDRRRERLLELAQYEALGGGGSGLHVAIARHADAAIREFSAEQELLVRRILLRLVNFGQGRADTRRQQSVAELRSETDDAAEFDEVLHQLAERRLITLQAAADRDDALVDLSHEALITAWPALRDWIVRRQADEQLRRRFQLKVDEWVEHGRGIASLLDAIELAEAEQWMQSDAAREVGYGSELSALISASHAEIERVQGQARESRRIVGTAHQEQGRTLLLQGRNLQALPYLVEARSAGIDGPVLRMLFAQAASGLPLAAVAGHSDTVDMIVFHPRGTALATASRDQTARIWDIATGAPVSEPLQHAVSVLLVAFSPDGASLATASTNGDVRVWSAATGAPRTRWLWHPGMVTAVAFDPAGTCLVTACEDGIARLWKLPHRAASMADVMSAGTTSDRPEMEIRHSAPITSVAFSSRDTLVIGGWDGNAQVWNAVTGRSITTFSHQDFIASATFSSDGARIATASWDCTARVWDAASGKPLTPPLEHSAVATTAVFSPDDARVVTGSLDGFATLWDVATSTIVQRLRHAHGVLTTAFSADGARLFTVTRERSAHVWEVATGKTVVEHRTNVSAAALDRTGTRIAIATFDGPLEVRDATVPDTSVRSIEYAGALTAAAVSPDRTRLAAATTGKVVWLWDTTTGAPVTTVLGDSSLWSIALARDGLRMIGLSPDRVAHVIDASARIPASYTLKGTERVAAIAISPDGRHAVTARSNEVTIWSIALRAPMAIVHTASDVHALEFSPEGSYLAVKILNETLLIRTATWKPERGALRHKERGAAAGRAGHADSGVWVSGIAFRLDGKRIVTSVSDHEAQIWDVVTARPVGQPLGLTDRLRAAVFSPDGARIATASGFVARIWSAATGIPMTVPLYHEFSVTSLAFSPDGSRLITAGDRVQLWDTATGMHLIQYMAEFDFDEVPVVSFNEDATRVVIASRHHGSYIWKLPMDMGSLGDWRAVLRRSPYELAGNVLTVNPHLRGQSR